MATNAYESQVVNYFKRRDEDGFGTLIQISPEQRYVQPFHNSGVNNLEEQFVIGIDSYCEGYTDDEGNRVITRIFCKDYDPENSDKYYKLRTTFYNVNIASSNYFQEEESSYLSAGYDNENNMLSLRGNTKGTATKNTKFTITKKDELFFVKEGVEIAVVTKFTERKFSEDGSKEFLQQRIENHLIEG